MLYGERLKLAMERRGDVIGQKITRKDVAQAADVSVQNIGMILTNAKGCDQKLNARSHAAVASYLKVNPEWLLNERGPMEPAPVSAPSELSPAAIELGALFDMIPADDRIRRAQAFNAASEAIMRVLQPADATR